MNNLIIRLKQFIEEYKDKDKDKENRFNQKYMEDDLIIPYKQSEFIVEVIEQLEESCNEAHKYYEMIMDYNRLLKNENENLRNKLYGQF